MLSTVGSSLLSRKKKMGLAPGTVVFTGDQKIEQVRTHYLLFNETTLEEFVFPKPEEFKTRQMEQSLIEWVDLRGIHDTAYLEKIGRMYHIHALSLEDISDVHQRPKFEEFEDGVLVIFKAFQYEEGGAGLVPEQVSLYFSSQSLISFQENESDLFVAVRDRIRRSSGRIRTRGTDYLAYALMDEIIDQYFLIAVSIEEQIEKYEDVLMDKPDTWKKEEVHRLEKDIMRLRRMTIPMREAISKFVNSDNPLIKEHTAVFIHDLQDQIIQLNEILDNCRDKVVSLHQLFIAEVSLKMNQVMHLLTLIATIFIPLTFLAGVYGMNFSYMPELELKYGYFVVLAIMLVIFIGLLIFFRRKRWI